MNNFSKFMRPQEYLDMCRNHPQADKLHQYTLKELERIAKKNGTCDNCDGHIWRLGQCGLCFTCTTGESDASEDYEIGEVYY